MFRTAGGIGYFGGSADVDRLVAVARLRQMEQIVDESVAQRRFQMMLVLLFAGAALVLASLGIYGVVSYAVALRRSEMGIRMALGAGRADILNLILRQGITPVALGLSGGIVASLATAHLLAGLLYGVAAVDPITIGGVMLVLGVVAAFASFLPARRATCVDPSTALRND